MKKICSLYTDLFLFSSLFRNFLQRFSDILVKYHYGYRSIVRKLKDAGFQVSRTRPIARPRRH